MNNLKMAVDYVKRASRCLREAESALREEDYPMAVRRAQECVELALKAVLRYIGVEYPRKHDVGDVLVKSSDRLPEGFRAERLAGYLKVLSLKRGPAMYGYEEELTPASELFVRGDAEEGVRMAMETLEEARRVIGITA
jgi:HEPN domain-containing protein